LIYAILIGQILCSNVRFFLRNYYAVQIFSFIDYDNRKLCMYKKRKLSTSKCKNGAIAAVLGLLGLVVVETVDVQQQAKAKGCESGLPNSARGFNASKGLCFGH
jgi:hypothetical protein